MATLTTDGSQADVQAKLNLAADGDIVVLPAGTFNWTSGVTSNTNCIITGSGYTLSGSVGAPSSLPTVINFTGTTSCIFANLKTTIVGKNWRLTGIKFIGTLAAGNSNNYFVGIVTATTKTNDPFHIDNCVFDSGTTAQNIHIVIGYVGPGLIDHCTFNAGPASEIIHNVGYPGGDTTGWNDDVTPGTINATYVENCYFYSTVINPGGYPTALIGADGSRSVVRYCTMYFCQVDQHGTAGQVGSRWFELYNNTFIFPSGCNSSSYFAIRAGSGVIYNNSGQGGPNSGHAAIGVFSDDTATPPPYGPGAGIFVSGSPNGIHSPVYLWNNTQTVSGEPPTIAISAPSANVTSGVNFFTSPTQPGTITVGQTAATANGTSLSYVPYTYPHPLVVLPTGGTGSSQLFTDAFGLYRSL